MRTVLSAIVLMAHVSFGQVILYEEHFTDGVTAIDWEPGWADSAGLGDSMQVDFMADNPSGDGIVGFVENVLSGVAVGTAVGGTLEMEDYMIQSWIYVTPDFGATAMAEYKGIVGRFSDEVGHTYYQFIADFNTLAVGGMKLRLRKYDGAGSVVIHDFFEGEIPGGIPAESGWHHMGLLMEGNELFCYWDFELLPGCPYADETGSPLLTAGKFGVFVFSFVGDDEVFCDDIFVTDGYFDSQLILILNGDVEGSDLILTWNTVVGASEYWIYGDDGKPFFIPGSGPTFEHRLTVLGPTEHTWSTTSGIGDPDTNWTYLVMAIDNLSEEITRSNRIGEIDYAGEIPHR